jgi:hypothetical protein
MNDEEAPRPRAWKRIAIGAGAIVAGSGIFIALGQAYALIGGT